MTRLDRASRHPGYWPSSWPVECGGNRRQKAAVGRLDAADGTATVATRRDDKWHVMVINREPGQWYLGGTMPAFSGPPPHGWVERIDPHSLESLVSSDELPCGDHVWCGAILAHANGSLVTKDLKLEGQGGTTITRLDPRSLEIIGNPLTLAEGSMGRSLGRSI